jgi:hypothetical protein
VADTRPAREAIERRAFEIYTERGGQDGQDLADWLAAETELAESADAQAPRPSTLVAKSVAVGRGATRPSRED